jgi:hypothetical protein
MDQARIDRDVRVLLEWLAEDVPTAGEMVLVLARALACWLEAIPMEERPHAVQDLWRALDDAIDQIEAVYSDIVIEAPLAIRH